MRRTLFCDERGMFNVSKTSIPMIRNVFHWIFCYYSHSFWVSPLTYYFSFGLLLNTSLLGF